MGKILTLVLIFSFYLSGLLSAQSAQIDSLRQILDKVQGEEQVDLLIELAASYKNIDVEEGLALADEALVLARNMAYPDGEASALLNKGRLLRMQSRYTEALENFFAALKLYESTRNKLQVAYVYNDIGYCYYDLEQADKLAENLGNALHIFEEIGDEKGIADVTNNLGIAHDLMGQFDSAIVYYERSLAMNQKLGEKEEAANCQLNMAAVFIIQKKYAPAQKLIEEARLYYIESKNLYAQIIVFIELANMSSAQGDYKSAVDYAEQGYSLANDYGSIHKAMNISSHLINYYSKLNDGSKAYKYFEIYDELKDSIFNEDNARLLNETETRFQTEIKEQEISALNQINKQEKFRRNAFAAFSFLILILGVLLINRKRNEARKNKLLYDKGQEVEKVKSSFFANMTHEFRTPLTLILGPIELLKEKITSKEATKQLDVMENNANRLLDLINQLLDLSKLESGNMKLQTEAMDIGLLINRITGLFESLAELKKIKVSVESRLSNSICHMDPDKIEKVLVNLISNALKFTPEGGNINISLDSKSLPENSEKRNIQIRITDSGRGIPPTDLEHIFDQYFQSSLNTSDAYSGTGIGLALSKELVELHGGSIAVKSELGLGAEFSLIIPDEQGIPRADSSKGARLYPRPGKMVLPPESEPARTDPAEGQGLSQGSVQVSVQAPLVLLVEDNQEVRDYVKDVLSSTYRIEVAENGLLGLNKARQIIPDLIISDVMMPEMDGLELCEKLKSDELCSHIPVILLTAKAAVEDRIEGLKHKADAYLAKPFVPNELLVRISNLTERHQKLREKYSREIVMKPGENKVKSVDEIFLEKLKTLIEENLDNEMLGVDDLASALSMSRSQLHRKMKALTNLAPNEFVRNYRLIRAKEMICSNTGTTAEVAFSVGFNSPSYFTRCFREYFGSPPSEVRKQQA